MSTETEALKQFLAAINRNDMQAVTRDFDPEIVRQLASDSRARSSEVLGVTALLESQELLPAHAARQIA
jgi:hypothetical protein